MRIVSTILQTIMAGLLVLIAYNTSTGSQLPVSHRTTSACDGLLARKLFYSTILQQSDNEALARRVKATNTAAAVDSLVTDGSNIDAKRTEWYRSDAEPGACEAQIYLKRPNNDGNTTAYVRYEVTSFVPSNAPSLLAASGQRITHVNVSLATAQWFKE